MYLSLFSIKSEPFDQFSKFTFSESGFSHQNFHVLRYICRFDSAALCHFQIQFSLKNFMVLTDNNISVDMLTKTKQFL